jgi:hypothetical protein
MNITMKNLRRWKIIGLEIDSIGKEILFRWNI